MKIEINPLKRRRLSLGYNQNQMSELMEITQSQYSRIENGSSDPTKYLKKLSEILKCKPDEIFKGKILQEIEDEFLTNPLREMLCTYHEKKPDAVYVRLEGWFTEEELSRFLILTIDGIKSENR